jgi:hypothetical protein
VAKFSSDLRPSALTSASLPALAVAASAQVSTLGQAAVETQVRTAPVCLLHAGVRPATKINNYNGTTSAKGEGTAMSTYEQKVSAARVQAAQVDKAKGGNARGIPPRGRPV